MKKVDDARVVILGDKDLNGSNDISLSRLGIETYHAIQKADLVMIINNKGKAKIVKNRWGD